MNSMKFRNKVTQETVEAKGYVQEFAYSHNSDWEKVEQPKEPTKSDIQKQLDELGIEYDAKAKKEDLLALLVQANNGQEGNEE